MFKKIAVFLVLAASPAAAQVQSRPTDPPLVTAVNESWYLQREPIQFAGELYYPAGAALFFNGNTMARTGHYNGVPIYMDTTIEPYSVLLVPVRRGLLQPYEKRRQGDLVGTTGSRTPSFPVTTSNSMAGGAVAQAAAPPTQPQQTIGAISTFTPGGGVGTVGVRETPPAAAPPPATANSLGAPAATGTSGRMSGPRQNAVTTASVRRPETNDGVWIEFRGEKWVSAGTAVPLRATEFKMVGQYNGFPVFIRSYQGTIEGDRIYLPTRAGLVAPYRLK